MNAARGCLLALAISVPLWALAIALTVTALR